jgi:hypothetical protein
MPGSTNARARAAAARFWVSMSMAIAALLGVANRLLVGIYLAMIGKAA